MSDPTPNVPSEPARVSAERYFALVREGVLAEADRVELLEGVIVSMAPSNPPHATAVGLVHDALRAALGEAACLRVQSPLAAGPWSAPEPDVAWVEGSHRDYSHRHPETARLVVEVADWSLHQDRLTKAPIYARAGVDEYWIVNLAARNIEVRRDPDPARGRFRVLRIASEDERIAPALEPAKSIAVRDVLPAPPTA